MGEEREALKKLESEKGRWKIGPLGEISEQLPSKNSSRSADWDRGFKHLLEVQAHCAKYVASWGAKAMPVDRVWQIAVDFILQAESARLKRLKRFRDSGRPLPEGMTVEEINRQLQEDRGEIKGLSKEFLAEHAKMGNEYAIFYSALSDVADSSPVGLRHYIEEGSSPGSVRINSSGSLLSPEFVMVLASSTQLEIFRIMREIRDDGIQDADLQRLLLENGQIIDTVREKSIIVYLP
jgi:hypothetical protein